MPFYLLFRYGLLCFLYNNAARLSARAMHIPAWPLGASSHKEDFGQIFFSLLHYGKQWYKLNLLINIYLIDGKRIYVKYCLFKLIDWEWTMLEGELAKCN